jgi:hypothetical protein
LRFGREPCRKCEVAELNTACFRLPDDIRGICGGFQRVQGAIHSLKARTSALTKRVLLHGREDLFRDALSDVRTKPIFPAPSFLQVRAKVMMATGVNPASFDNR